MKKMIPLVLAALFALAPGVSLAQEYLAPLWQKLPVTWISSKPADGTAGSYSFSSTAPVYHNANTPGWNSTLWDTSMAIDVSNSFFRQRGVMRLVAYDSTDVFQFLRFKVTFNPANDVDTAIVLIDMSTDGATWTLVDSTNFHPIRTSLTSGNGVATTTDTTAVTYINNIGGNQWDLDQLSPKSGFPNVATINYTRTGIHSAKFIRFRVRRDKSFACNNCASISYAGKAYNVDVWLWSTPPYTSTGSVTR